MSKQVFAIATCRVSSIEQLKSNSLNRQRKSVLSAAEYLNATLTQDGIWSGSVSSKSGRNYSRKDLNQMLDYCRKNPSVNYLIVDEIDRFMRSIDEMFYFEVLFREKVGVKVWYAEDPDLNSDDPLTKLRRAMKAFEAEGSNEERQRKSIKGQSEALNEGRWTFVPKPGYMKGRISGVPEIHPTRGKALQKVLKDIANRRVTPSQGLKDLNNSAFTSDGHSPYKMDKFREIVVDPFNAGIISMDKQVKVYNPNGLHEALITVDQHNALVKVMSGKEKTQKGPNKEGNPRFPCNNIVACKECKDTSNGRYVGFKHSNGKGTGLTYEKYRCRSCKRYTQRENMHNEVEKQFIPLSDEATFVVRDALNMVWKQEEEQAGQEANRIEQQINALVVSINSQVESLADLKNLPIQDEIRNLIEKKKATVLELRTKLETIQSDAENDKDEFIEFAYSFIREMGDNFLDTNLVSKENRLRCKQLVFPEGFWVDDKNKVYTPKLSELYRAALIKKDALASDNSRMVRVPGL